MNRPEPDVYFLRMAKLVATRSTCLRRSVGCVLVNTRNHVLATGYNGVAAGMPHCNESDPRGSADSDVNPILARIIRGRTYLHACPGAESVSGTELDACQAIHAEQNALLQCRDVHAIDVAYCTTEPCVTCAKLLLNTSCRRIVSAERYAHEAARELWMRSGREWITMTHLE